jgi:glycerophosphoryl diester phosphodiesterase
MDRPVTGYAYLDTVLDPPGSVLAMAHRGGAGHPDLCGLENTMPAFEHAVALGFRYLETDVHATADGRLIAFHDAELDRVTDRGGRVAELTGAEVARARIGGAHPIPLMADLLEAFPQCRFNIDVKDDAAVDPLVDLVNRAGAHQRVLIGSFSLRRLRRFRRLTAGRVATSAAPSEVAPFVALPMWRLDRMLAGGARALQVPHRRGPLPVVTAGLVRRAHAAGAQVHVWTVDDPAEMEELLDLGVDGLITDRTDLLKDVLVRRGLWRDLA